MTNKSKKNKSGNSIKIQGKMKTMSNRSQQSREKIPAAGPDKVLINGVLTTTGKKSRNRGRKQKGLPGRVLLPQFTTSQLDVFDSRSFGVKIPDESSAPSAVAFSRNLGPINTGTTGFGTVVYRYHPLNYAVVALPAVGPNWTFSPAFAGGIPVSNQTPLTVSFGALRTAAFGIKISTRQAYTAASGFVHVALVPDVIDRATWAYPLSISAMEYAPVYRRIPVADLVENDIIVMSKFTDATGFRYYDPNNADFIASAVTAPFNTTGWMSIIITIEGPASVANAIDVEYLSHYEGLVAAAAGQGVIEVTKAAPHSPAIMASTSFVVEEIQQIRVCTDDDNEEPSFWTDAVQAFKLGVNIANGISQLTSNITALSM